MYQTRVHYLRQYAVLSIGCLDTPISLYQMRFFPNQFAKCKARQWCQSGLVAELGLPVWPPRCFSSIHSSVLTNYEARGLTTRINLVGSHSLACPRLSNRDGSVEPSPKRVAILASLCSIARTLFLYCASVSDQCKPEFAVCAAAKKNRTA